jgi:hypothetical protein
MEFLNSGAKKTAFFNLSSTVQRNLFACFKCGTIATSKNNLDALLRLFSNVYVIRSNPSD